MHFSSGNRRHLKGTQINSADELVLTELILENTLASYEPEEVVALLSCFVFQEKTDVEPAITPKLQEGRDAIMAIAERVGAVQDYNKVPRPDFRALKFGLMEAVYEWAKGMVLSSVVFTQVDADVFFIAFQRNNRSYRRPGRDHRACHHSP